MSRAILAPSPCCAPTGTGADTSASAGKTAKNQPLCMCELSPAELALAASAAACPTGLCDQNAACLFCLCAKRIVEETRCVWEGLVAADGSTLTPVHSRFLCTARVSPAARGR